MICIQFTAALKELFVTDVFAVRLTVTRTQNVLGEKGRRIRELTAVVQKRFGFPEGSVEVNDLG